MKNKLNDRFVSHEGELEEMTKVTDEEMEYFEQNGDFPASVYERLEKWEKENE